MVSAPYRVPWTLSIAVSKALVLGSAEAGLLLAGGEIGPCGRAGSPEAAVGDALTPSLNLSGEALTLEPLGLRSGPRLARSGGLKV